MNKKTMYQNVMTILKESPAYRKAADCLDYTLCPCSSVESLDDDYIHTLHGQVEEGSNEGIYVDLIAEERTPDGPKVMPIGVWKTLDESPEAYEKMGIIAGLATWAAYKAWREAA